MLYPHDLSPPARDLDAALVRGEGGSYWRAYTLMGGGVAYTCLQPGVYEGPFNFGNIMRDIYGKATAEFVRAQRAAGATDTGDESVDSYLTFRSGLDDMRMAFDALATAAEAARMAAAEVETTAAAVARDATSATRRAHRNALKAQRAALKAHRKALKLIDAPPSYCVCDNVDQALRFWKAKVADPQRAYVIALSVVRRHPENRGKGGGWRWHKWGRYIGRKRPHCEYLDDEPNISEVFVAEIFEVQEHTFPAAGAEVSS